MKFSSNHSLRATLAIVALVCAQASTYAQDVAEYGKNIHDVEFRDLPADVTSLPALEPEKWNFGFRPYGSADMLWTDPILQRSVTSGEGAGDKAPTALNVTCNTEGFTILVLCVEPSVSTVFANTNNYPAPGLEMFFTPGDFDTPSIQNYYQIIYGHYGSSSFREFPWLVEGRDFRPVLPFLSGKDYTMEKGFMVRINIPWEPLFDRLPIFTKKRDNFWRLSMIRWASSGGQTWGGTVHKASQAGYIRWPDFTEAQKTAIMKHLLCRAWISFNNDHASNQFKTAKGWSGIQPRESKWRAEELAANPRSYVLMTEDPNFRPTLEALVAECKALAPTIGIFETLPFSEQVAFYQKASDMLFNFRYDVEEAYTEYEKNRLFQ